MHFLYIMFLSLYIYNTYLIGIYGECTSYYLFVLMSLGPVYPISYDIYQFYQQGIDYFKDVWNYSDMLCHISSILNIIFQGYGNPYDMKAAITMSLVLSLMLIKTMFFLRIFSSFSYLITLIREVISDLKQFMLFYMILIYMFSLILGVIGWQNYTRDEELWQTLQDSKLYPGVEYFHIGNFLGNMITIARMTIGDNDFGATHYMDYTI
jgi:glucan phosphoethanolaminetransferase (alkaline phosphatase superfamily)